MRSGDPCPCGSGRVYGACCAPLHLGARLADTPEELMRSRYSAFAAGATDYLIATWHPRTRPHALDLDLARRWTRLDIHEATDDTVEFTAHSARGGYQETLHERSRFARRGGRWFYVDGDVVTDD